MNHLRKKMTEVIIDWACISVLAAQYFVIIFIGTKTIYGNFISGVPKRCVILIFQYRTAPKSIRVTYNRPLVRLKSLPD